MIKLSNGIEVNFLSVWWEGVKFGQINFSKDGLMSFERFNDVDDELLSYAILPLNNNSTHGEILEFIEEELTITPTRMGRAELFPDWVETIFDELYVTKGSFWEMPNRVVTFNE